MDTFVLCVRGFDDHPDETYTIPAVRKFFADLQRKWPGWLYYVNIDLGGGAKVTHGTLRMMSFCCLQSLRVERVAGSEERQIQCDANELARLVAPGFAVMDHLCEAADVREDLVRARRDALIRYFGLATVK